MVVDEVSVPPAVVAGRPGDRVGEGLGAKSLDGLCDELEVWLKETPVKEVPKGLDEELVV